jgi:hypothetical protein
MVLLGDIWWCCSGNISERLFHVSEAFKASYAVNWVTFALCLILLLDKDK